MEKLPARGGLKVVAGDFGWSDVGSWDALAAVREADPRGNTIVGEAIAIDARRNILCGEKLIAVVGVEDLVVIATDDAVLVMPRERAQEVRNVVAALETEQRKTYL
jgi:mannose-1-phosphate guanylyltransferase